MTVTTPPLFYVDTNPAQAGRIWTLVIPAPDKWLTANPSRNNYYARSAQVRKWRQAGCDAGIAAGLPQHVDLVHFHGTARYHGHAPVRDRDNLRPTLKAVIDGLTPPKTVTRKGKTYHYPGCSLLVDDNDRHVAGTDITLERVPGDGRDELVLIIKEIIR